MSILTFPADGKRLSAHLAAEAYNAGLTLTELAAAARIRSAKTMVNRLSNPPAQVTDLTMFCKIADALGLEIRIGLRWKAGAWQSPAARAEQAAENRRAKMRESNKGRRVCPICGERIRLGNWRRHERDVHGITRSIGDVPRQSTSTEATPARPATPLAGVYPAGTATRRGLAEEEVC